MPYQRDIGRGFGVLTFFFAGHNGLILKVLWAKRANQSKVL